MKHKQMNNHSSYVLNATLNNVRLLLYSLKYIEYIPNYYVVS